MSAYVGLLACVLVWGSNFVASGWLDQQFTPLTVPALRLVFTGLFLLAAGLTLHQLRPVSKRQLLALAVIGVVGTLLNQVCFFQAVRYVSPTESALIMAAAPFATGIFARFLLHERLTTRMVVGAAITITGVYTLLSADGHRFHTSVGDLYAAGAMLTFSLNLVLIRKLSDDLSPYTVTAYGTWLGTGLFLPVSAIAVPHPVLAHTALAWLILALSGILSQGVAGLVWNRTMQIVGAAKSSILLNLQPFVAMAVGYVVLGQPITGGQLLGGTLIVFGVILASANIRGRHFHFGLPSVPQ